MRGFTATVGAAAVCALGSASSANIIDSFATGADLDGGVITVFWADGAGGIIAVTQGAIVADGPESATATIPNATGTGPGAIFSIDGETFTASWMLENTSLDLISEIAITIGGTGSVFHNRSDNTGSPGSAFGRPGVVYDAVNSTAPEPTSAFEYSPLVDPVNTAGDLFLAQRISWDNTSSSNFGPGQIFTWFDDTDRIVIPAPASLALLGVSGLVATRRRR